MNRHRPTLSSTFTSSVPPSTLIGNKRSSFGSDSAPQRTTERVQCFTLSPLSSSVDNATQMSAPRRLPSIQSRFAVQTQSDDRHVKDLAARLALLLHAHECYRGGAGCDVANCSIARGVLDHCQECFLADGSCHASCAQAKHLLRHYRICRTRNFPVGCAICTTLQSEYAWALQHAASLTPLFLQIMHTTLMPSQQQQSASSTQMSSSPLQQQVGSNHHSARSIAQPAPLRRVVSDDLNHRRQRQTEFPLPNTAKRCRVE